MYDKPVVREPYKIREMMDEESNTFLGYIYYYRGEQGIWTAFTRLETNDGFILPMPERRRGSGRRRCICHTIRSFSGVRPALLY